MVHQLTAIVVLSDGTHLCTTGAGAGWEVFRRSLLQTVLDYLVAVTDPGLHVVCGAIAHHDHFHLIESQREFFAMTADTPWASSCAKGEGVGTCH